MSDNVNNTAAAGLTADAASTNAAIASSFTRPSTPPMTINGTQTNSAVVPGAPRRPNAGRVDVDGNVIVEVSTDADGFINGMTESPTVVRSGLLSHKPETTNFTGSPWWVGPPAVNGHLVNNDDPFTMHGMALSAAAPAFNPRPSWYQREPPPPPPYMGGSSGGSPPAPEGDSSNNCGSSHRAADESNDRSSGSNSRNAQCSDDTGPVIVNGSTPNKKGKQPVFSDATRFLRVENVQVDDFHPEMLFGRVKALQSFKEDVQKNGIFALKPNDIGTTTVFMFCDSKLTACALKNKLQTGFRETVFISQQEFEAADIEIPDEIDRLSGKVILSASVKEASRSGQFSLSAVSDMAKTAAAKFGKISSFKNRSHNGGNGWAPTVARYEVEYDSVKDACDAILNTNTVFGACNPQTQGEHIDIHVQALNAENISSWVARQTGTGYEFSGTGRTGTRLNSRGQPTTIPGYSTQPAMPGPASRPQTQPTGFGAPQIYQEFNPVSGGIMQSWDGYVHPNISRPQDVIDKKIEDGSDCRTTLMVRNLPADYTKEDFIRLLNAICPGKYDFAYNRIDFNKNQSVGYGFVNFISATWLLVFVKACRGKLLHHGVTRRHMKPCAVSYANVQGYECLVAKFRNSSILEEADGCRPTLFWSDESAPSSAMVGGQRLWPRVDNDSKKARSMENAQTLGLYTPRRANGGRGGRGGRHSRYDRGTTAQQTDEHYNNYNVAPNATMAPFGHVPRYQPQMGFDARTQQSQHFVPAGFQAYGGPQAAGSMLRSHTNGQLGYTQPMMPAFLAPVTFPDQGQAVTQDEFAPLLYTQKHQVQQYYRRV